MRLVVILRIKPNNVVLTGIRALDEGARATVRQSGVVGFIMRYMDELGMTESGGRAFDAANIATGRIHVRV